MSTVTIGPQKYFNTTATDSQRSLIIDSGYTAGNIFRIGNSSIEIVIANKNSTFGNGVRICFDDPTGIAGGEYIVVPGGQTLVCHPNCKFAIYYQRDASTNVDISVMVVRKNSFNSF